MNEGIEIPQEILDNENEAGREIIRAVNPAKGIWGDGPYPELWEITYRCKGDCYMDDCPGVHGALYGPEQEPDHDAPHVGCRCPMRPVRPDAKLVLYAD
jgi:hypothetical protein